MTARDREEFARSLVGAVPRLVPLLNEHLDDNFGEMLSHVFFGDLTRYVIHLYVKISSGAASQADREVLKGILDELEKGLVLGDPDIQNLIAVSFLENLPQRGESGVEIRSLLGPALRGELDRQ